MQLGNVFDGAVSAVCISSALDAVDVDASNGAGGNRFHFVHLDLDVADPRQVLVHPALVVRTQPRAGVQRAQLVANQVIDALAPQGDELANSWAWSRGICIPQHSTVDQPVVNHARVALR